MEEMLAHIADLRNLRVTFMTVLQYIHETSDRSSGW
jgi:lipoate synthase